MYKNEALSIIEKELKDNPGATSIEISQKYSIPLKTVEFFIKLISKGQKKDEPVTKDADEKLLVVRRDSNQEDIQQRVKNHSSAFPAAQEEVREDEGEKEGFKCENGRYITQVLAYAANIDSVSVVDVLKGKEIKRIPLSLIPLDVAISPDKRYVYVTYPDEITPALGVISIAKNKEIARVILNEPPFNGALPLGVAVSPDGRYIYTANYESSNMSIIEASRWGWSVIGEIPLTKRPEHLAITPNGRLAYVTLRDDSEIAVVDLLANLQIKIIPAGTRPIGIAINEDYVGLAANPGSDDVTFFNAKLAEVSPVAIPVGDTPVSVAFNPEGDIAYVTNRLSNTVSVIDVFQHKVIATIPVGTQPVGIALTEEGRYSAVANVGEDTVSIIDNSKGTVIDTVAVGEFPFAIKIATVIKWPGSHK